MKRDWQGWEKDIAAELGLNLTAGSGNQFYDPGDATTHEHPGDRPLQFQVEAKYTERATRTIGAKWLRQQIMRAGIHGKVFLLAVRLWPRAEAHPMDVVVLHKDDFLAICEKAGLL